jgi:hypothetical protein
MTVLKEGGGGVLLKMGEGHNVSGDTAGGRGPLPSVQVRKIAIEHFNL